MTTQKRCGISFLSTPGQRGANVSEQSHSEAWGGRLATEALSRVMDLSGFLLLLQNDASAAIVALQKGSFGSSALQRVALRLDTLCAKRDIDLSCMHVPGLALIEVGTDRASRGRDASGQDANVERVRVQQSRTNCVA